MGKNKNKNRFNQPAFQPVKNVQPRKEEVTTEDVLEIEAKYAETGQLIEAQQVLLSDSLSTEAQARIKEAEAKDDLKKYWIFVKEVNRRLEALINKTEEEKNKTNQIKEELEGAKKEVDLLKADFKKKLEEYNRKDKDLTEREFALDNGEYSGVISRLLNTLKDTERKIFVDTELLIKDLADFHQKNLEELAGHQKDSISLEKQAIELKRERKKFEIEKKIFEEDFKADIEFKYSEDIRVKGLELQRLQRRAENLDVENKKLKQLFEDLQNAFDSAAPEEILRQYSALQKDLSALKEELNKRPENFELESKQAQIEELRAKVQEYQTKVNEGELLELKRILSNQDSYVIEINAYKNQIESAKVREASLKKTIEDLSVTIDQLKGESNKKADAFEFAKKCDQDTVDLGYNHLQKPGEQPKDLKELCAYVQNWMAYKADKPFFYKLETIRIFLAGLHMSPISILQGISGTGKTSLPREFAKALLSNSNYLGLNSNNQNNSPYTICAIQSGWRDSMDLLGYYNSFEHKYKETEFFKALYLANQPKYSDSLYFIILDEMNLSRPEHYFADFLSLLEQAPDERFITLINTPEEVMPASVKGGKLRVPKNVRFIGTANHDETTLEFAPKTYDRSNLMEMPKNHPGKPVDAGNKGSYNVTYSWLETKFLEAEGKHKAAFEKFTKFLNSDDIKYLLMEKGIGMGNRLEYQAEKFIGVYLESGSDLNKDLPVAVDHLVTSRLLRTLKNRYDLDKANLVNFKEEYQRVFKTHFQNQQPSFAVDLLDVEIGKK